MTSLPKLQLPPAHHLAALAVASLLTVSILAELLVGTAPILLFAEGSWHVLPALTATQQLANAQAQPMVGAVWPLIHTASTLDPNIDGWGALVEWWVRATRYVTAVTAVVALVSSAAGLLLGWLATIEHRLFDFVLRHAVALCGSLPSLILVGVTRVSGRFPVGLDLIVVLLTLRSVEVAHLVRTQLVALRDQEFVTAARAVGGSHWHVLTWHLLPHLRRPLASLAASTLASVVALEAAMSLIGLRTLQHASWGAALVSNTNSSGPGARLALLCALLSLLAAAGASILLARRVQRDRWVEQRHV
ncbi:MAG TPA: ABC transporter permease subunit [Polyangiaceae bacterium]|nr:ABC transporter permease subunit [Polyangiaceae bacterium]